MRLTLRATATKILMGMALDRMLQMGLRKQSYAFDLSFVQKLEAFLLSGRAAEELDSFQLQVACTLLFMVATRARFVDMVHVYALIRLQHFSQILALTEKTKNANIEQARKPLGLVGVCCD
jgi:hypothetical protein